MDIGFDGGFVLPLRQQKATANTDGCPHGLWISQEDVMPANLDVLKKVLKAESSHVKYWILLAFCYRGSGEADLFEHLLKEAEGRIDVTGKDSTEDCRGAIYSALTIHNFTQADQFAHHEKRHVRHLDLANHYMSRREDSDHYTWDISMGQRHLSNFLHHHQYEERTKAKECFCTAMTKRPQSVITIIYYANILVMENQYHLASIYYMRALLQCNQVEIMLKLRKEFSNPSPPDEMECDIDQLKMQIRYLKASLLFALACCKFYELDIGGATTLVDSSLSTLRTPMALRLKAVIAASHILDKTSEAESNTASHSITTTPRASSGSLINEWNKAVCEAYLLEPPNGIGQLHLCEFLFQHGLIDECQRRLGEIKRHMLPPNLHAELTYQLGRCYHVKGDMIKAFAMYSNVLGLRSDFLPARVQLIRAAIGSDNLSVAREHCDFLGKHNYKGVELLRLTGLAYLVSAIETLDSCRAQLLKTDSKLADIDIMYTLGNVQHDVGRLVDERLFKGMGVLDEALAMDPHDKLSQEYLICCLELLLSRGRENLTSRLRDAYVKYATLGITKTSVAFRNNDAILALRSREWDEGLEKLTSLWNEISGSADISESIKLTVQFNLAVAHEEAGNTSKARKMYSQLTCEYPRYASAWLRKSNMAFRRGDVVSGQRYLEQFKSHNRRSLDPWLCKAYHFFSRGNLDECIEELRKLFRAINNASFDAYANTLFACALIRRSNRGGFSPLPKEVLHYARAGLRRHALCNFYAANCVAIYLAHEGQLKAAYESFGILLENSNNNSHMKFVAHWNMGLFCAATALGNERRVERGNYDKLRAAKAQQHFQTAIGHGKLNAGAYLVYARFLYDCQRFEECVQLLESCRRMFPKDRKFLYNLVVAVDAMLCKHMRNSDMLASATEVSKMIVHAQFVKTMTTYLISIQSEYPKMSLTHLQQIASRISDKLMPHMTATLPQLEAAAAAKQLTKGKHLELQMSIQQAHEAKRKELELERQRAAEAERLLSEQLLKEASDIASELVYSRPPGPGSNR